MGKKRKARTKKVAIANRSSQKSKKTAARRQKRSRTRHEVKVKTPEDRLCWRLVGVGLLAFSLLAALALASFDAGAADGSGNLVGIVGHAFARFGYAAFGLAAWCFPMALAIGGIRLFEPIPQDVEEVSNGRIALRICGFLLMVLVITGVVQLTGHWEWMRRLLAMLQIGDDAGGWVGRMFMTQGLERCVAAFGAVFLSAVVFVVALCMALGLKTVRRVLSFRMPDVGSWISSAADSAKEGIEVVKETARVTAESVGCGSEARPAPVIRPARKPSKKMKYSQDGNLPPLSLLDPLPPKTEKTNDAETMGVELMRKLKVFGVEAALSYTVEGPVVTQFAIKPGEGVRVDKITGLARDLQLALKAKSLRIFAPIPGEDAVGIQVSNSTQEPVMFREIIESAEWQRNVLWPKNGSPKIPVPLLLGKNVAGDEVVEDLTKMPHLLVAGASGKGKSVCLNSIINGLLMCRTPEQLRIILVDPKRTEFSAYQKLPHLLIPVVVEPKKVLGALKWAAKEMETRLRLFAEARARDIIEYNASVQDKTPYIVVVIDEVADIMTLCGREVEPVLGRLMALARASGIHLILATQRPDAKTISGTIKANIPGRVAFKTTNATDSRTILDEGGAEVLLGKGDMLYKTNDGLIRAQGAFVGKGEMERIIEFTVGQWPAQIDEGLVAEIEREEDSKDDDSSGDSSVSEEEYRKAHDIVVQAKRASISSLQRQMRIGYNHAAKIIDLLEKRGVIGPSKGVGPRDVLVEE